jgi:hypothetical protein
MSGYAAVARIERARPRIVARERDLGWPGDEPALTLGAVVAASRRPTIDVGPATESADPLIERWAAFRERLSALTFFLFNAEGWR